MNEERYGYVYKTTCINENSSLYGKYYIGQHKAKEFDTKYFGSGNIIKKYIKKYGTDGLVCEILEWANSKEELNELEAIYVTIDLIKNDIDCINMVNGGQCGNMWECMNEDQRNNRNIKAGNAIHKKHKEDLEFHQRWLEKNNDPIRRKETGRKISEKWKNDKEYREKIIKAAIEQWKDPNSKTRIAHKNKVITDEIKQKISDAAKKQWERDRDILLEAIANSNRKERLREVMKEKFADPEWQNKWRHNQSIAQKKRFEDPEQRKHQSEIHLKVCNTPEHKQKMSKIMKECFQDETKRKHISDGHKKHHKEHPETSEKMSFIGKQRYIDNPLLAKENSKRLKEMYDNNPELKQRIADKVKLYWQTHPEAKNKLSEKNQQIRSYNNGILQTRTSKCPEGWVEGTIYKRIPKDWEWYNNGIINVRYKECPDGFKPGKIKKKSHRERRLQKNEIKN